MKLNIVIGLILLCGTTHAATLSVGQNGCNYNSIQAAIDGANSGDIIEVQNGIYMANINVTKQVILRGINKPVIDDGGFGSAITLSAERITIEGFIARNSGAYPNAGIKVISSNNIIRDNEVNNNQFNGIYIIDNSGNNIIDNNLAQGNFKGISIEHSNDNTITNNIANHNNCGIAIEFPNNNSIKNNVAHDNESDGIFIGIISKDNDYGGNDLSNNGKCNLQDANVGGMCDPD